MENVLMKSGFAWIMLLLLSLTVILLSCDPIDKDEDIANSNIVTVNTEKDIADALTVIFNRKSVREYTEDNVDRNTLELLVKAGMAAPTAGNRQPWAFLVIDNRGVLIEMVDFLPYGRMLDHAAAAIVVCGDLTKVNKDGPEYWVQDCSAATQNILLAAEALGLGAVWIGVYPSEQRTIDAKTFFNLPEDIVPLSVISIGYPKGEQIPKDKWDEQKVKWNSWN